MVFDAEIGRLRVEGMQTGGAPGSGLSATDAQLLEVRARTALITRVSIMGAVACMLVVLGVLATSGDLPESAADRDVFALVFGLAGLGSLAGGYLTPRFMPVVPPAAPQVPAATSPPMIGRVLGALTYRSIAQAAFFEVPALLGFVLAFMGVRPLLYLPLFAVSLAALATTIPRKDAWLQEIADATHPGIPQGLT